MGEMKIECRNNIEVCLVSCSDCYHSSMAVATLVLFILRLKDLRDGVL